MLSLHEKFCSSFPDIKNLSQNVHVKSLALMLFMGKVLLCSLGNLLFVQVQTCPLFTGMICSLFNGKVRFVLMQDLDLLFVCGKALLCSRGRCCSFCSSGKCALFTWKVCSLFKWKLLPCSHGRRVPCSSEKFCFVHMENPLFVQGYNLLCSYGNFRCALCSGVKFSLCSPKELLFVQL